MKLLANPTILLHNEGVFLFNEGTVNPIPGFYYGIIVQEERPSHEDINNAVLQHNATVVVQEEIEVTFLQEI